MQHRGYTEIVCQLCAESLLYADRPAQTDALYNREYIKICQRK